MTEEAVPTTYLDFEKPLAELDKRLDSLRRLTARSDAEQVELLDLEGLGDVVVGVCPEALQGAIDRRERGDDDDAGVGLVGADPAEHFLRV